MVINKSHMSTLTDFITHWGDVIDLDFPGFDCNKIKEVCDKHPGWKTYQPHKMPNNRFGLSVTSLDGGFSGDPDLMSLRECKKLTGRDYREIDFQARTNIVSFLPEIDVFLDFWGKNLGRTHFLRLDKGGYFPPHRDNGTIVLPPTFRILVPIHNFGTNDMKWVQENNVLKLEIGHVYFINTSKVHSLFSFTDNCLMLVLNIVSDELILNKLVQKVDAI